MLPAIWFILSRQGCDQAALAAGLGAALTTVEEQEAIAAELRDLRCGSIHSSGPSVFWIG
jgi:hypothetical protein